MTLGQIVATSILGLFIVVGIVLAAVAIIRDRREAGRTGIGLMFSRQVTHSVGSGRRPDSIDQ